HQQERWSRPPVRRAAVRADPRRRRRLLVFSTRKRPPLDPVGAVVQRRGPLGPPLRPPRLLQPERDTPVEERRLRERPDVTVRPRLRDPDRQTIFHRRKRGLPSPPPARPNWVNSRAALANRLDSLQTRNRPGAAE